jgi:hypothetical protein
VSPWESAWASPKPTGTAPLVRAAPAPAPSPVMVALFPLMDLAAAAVERPVPTLPSATAARSTDGVDRVAITAVRDATRRSEPAAVEEAHQQSQSRLMVLAAPKVARLAVDQHLATAAPCTGGADLLPTTVALDVTPHPALVIRSCRTFSMFRAWIKVVL